ncbi:NAD-dependent epimerase/dehydratase family protein [Microvirga sp. VF16]|uniref:NAD-dependent epimerase/dehydratase family protein n=1 Tax=Microvirga sp. VF16 TaxID=2807101 RepID=UPI00193E6520|nr:NAD-dependent epimerase/dehydratase family protein [Microvirga sp. VF16]QRM28271.1 NAD-dependent epimerase/dehydratase family protein [Microvirga sp. VF16]
MSSYLVTGGCGFIGSHLVETLLADGHSVRVLDNFSTGKRSNCPAEVEIIEGDVADAALVADAMRRADGCFHLAAVASVELGNQDWLGTHRANLSGTIAVFNAARQGKSGRPIPVVYASSAAVYGNNPNVPLQEHATKAPRSAYGADKLGCEQHALVAGIVHGVPTCGLRFFNVYGPRQDPNSPYSGVISIFCKRLKTGEPITIFGDGSQTRDFVYVSDIARALIAGMEHASIDGNVYNVCTGRPTTIVDLAGKIAECLGVDARPDFALPRKGEIRESVGDPIKASLGIGFSASVDLKLGLAQTIDAI